MKVAFTIVTGHGDRCGKGFVVANGGEKGEDVGEDGVGGVDVESLPVSPLVSGDFATVEADWDDFGGVLDGMAHNQMLMHGVCVAHGRSWKSGRIVSAGLEKRLLAEASATGVGGGGDGGRGRGSDGGDNGIDFVSRTKPNFDQNREGSRYGNVLMIDVDGVEDGETIESVLRRLLDVYPVLRGLRDRFGCWAMPSASSMIFRDEVCARGLGGIHFYFALDSTLCDIDIRSSVAEYFKVMGWAAGVNRFEVRTHEYGAKMYERGIIDFSVFQAERLDFIGGAWCGPGLEQRRGSAIRFTGTGTGTGTGTRIDFEISDRVRGRAAAAMSAARQKASAEVSRINAEIDRRVVAGGEGGVVSGTVGGVVGVGVGGRALRSKLGAGVLPGGVILEREDGVRVSVTEVILYCGDHLGKYFCDPLYPEKGRKKAQIFWNKENDASSRFVLSSFVGGGCVYTLEPDAGEVLRILKGLAESGPRGKEIVGAAMEEKDWWVTEFGRLDQVGLDSVIAYIGSLRLGGGVGGKTELRNRVAAASSVDKELEVWRDREAVLEELNKRFAYVAIGGKPAYVEYREDSREWVIRDRNGFLAELEGEPKVCKVGAGGWDGKMKFEPLALAWLEWKGRRSYDDFIFNPAVDKREYVEKGTGRRVLNKFRGFSVKPARSEEFACGKVGCGGLGCLKWFFGPGGGGLCSAESAGEVCGWTYWLKTILDVAAAGDMQGARWIVDWFADILRNPGGRDGGRAREKRSGVCLTLKGGMGTGKDSIVEPIMKLLAPHSWELAEMDRFTAKHNTYMEGNLLMHGAEVMWGGSQKEGNRLKQIITGEEITIEPKYYAPYSVTNYCRYFFSTNADWSVPAGHDERRHTVFQVTDAHKQDRAWFAKVKAGRLEELLAMLLDFEPEMDVFTFFHTAELDEQKQMSAPMELEFVELVWDSDIYFDGAGVGRAVAYTQIAADFQSMFGPRRTLKTAEQFKRGFNKLLKTHGYYDAINRKVRVGKGYVNGLTMPSRDWWKEEFPFMGFC